MSSLNSLTSSSSSSDSQSNYQNSYSIKTGREFFDLGEEQVEPIDLNTSLAHDFASNGSVLGCLNEAFEAGHSSYPIARVYDRDERVADGKITYKRNIFIFDARALEQLYQTIPSSIVSTSNSKGYLENPHTRREIPYADIYSVKKTDRVFKYVCTRTFPRFSVDNPKDPTTAPYTLAQKNLEKFVDLYFKASEGDPVSQFELALAYKNGKITDQNLEAAFEWFTSAKESGNTQALYHLASCYDGGEGVEKDQAKAIELFAQAARPRYDCPNSQFRLAEKYLHGLGVEVDWKKAIKLYTDAAGQGFIPAQTTLADIYLGDFHENKNLREAVKWLHRAARHQDSSAQYSLGVCYEKGQGVELNSKTAMEWYQKAALRDHSLAKEAVKRIKKSLSQNQNSTHGKRDREEFREQKEPKRLKTGIDSSSSISSSSSSSSQNDKDLYLLARSYECGSGGVEKNLHKAAELYEQAAGFENDCPYSQCRLGELYEKGLIGDKDLKKAFLLYRDAAEQGTVRAQVFLVDAYNSGNGLVGKDLEEKLKWMHRAAKQGFPLAEYGLSRHYGKGIEKDLKQVFNWCKAAAEHGHLEAQHQLAVCYYGGEGVQRDLGSAFKWFRAAAERGFAKAQYILGLAYQKGEGVEKSLEEAAKWIKAAAEQGHVLAQWDLSGLYYRGEGVEKDLKLAIQWCRTAAERGNDRAQFNLGNCYELGEGVEKDLPLAMEWFRKAAAQGNAAAQKRLEEHSS